MSPEEIIVLDTTLRDGAQSPGAECSFRESMEIAKALVEAGVDIIEAGFPVSNDDNSRRVRELGEWIKSEGRSTRVAGLMQLRPNQLSPTIDAVGEDGIVHFYVPGSAPLMAASLPDDFTPGKAVKLIKQFSKSIIEARRGVQFSIEDYSRIGVGEDSNFNLATDLWMAAADGVQEAGGKTITLNAPDTVGFAEISQPDYFVHLMNEHARLLREAFPDLEIIWSTHNHNDIGCAVENTMNAILHGPARQIEVTVNGVGERAGNTELQTAVMRLLLHYADRFYTNVDTTRFKTLGELVSTYMLTRQANAPYGANAHTTSSGGHASALVKDEGVYYAVDPRLIGSEATTVFGPHSGSNQIVPVMQKAGYPRFAKETAKMVLEEVKGQMQARGRYKGLSDDELVQYVVAACRKLGLESGAETFGMDLSAGQLRRIVQEQGYPGFTFRAALTLLPVIQKLRTERKLEHVDHHELLQLTTESHGMRNLVYDIHTDEVSFCVVENESTEKLINPGDPTRFRAMERILLSQFPHLKNPKVVDLQIGAETTGSDADAGAKVTIEVEGQPYVGQARHQDTEMSGLLALTDAYNKASFDRAFCEEPEETPMACPTHLMEHPLTGRGEWYEISYSIEMQANSAPLCEKTLRQKMAQEMGFAPQVSLERMADQPPEIRRNNYELRITFDVRSEYYPEQVLDWVAQIATSYGGPEKGCDILHKTGNVRYVGKKRDVRPDRVAPAVGFVRQYFERVDEALEHERSHPRPIARPPRESVLASVTKERVEATCAYWSRV